MGASQPYMYDPDSRDPWSAKSDFDPKAVTRASWEAKPAPRKKKQDGPLVSFNQHPDLMEVPSGRTSTWKPMSESAKTWIVRMRWWQLAHRVVELFAATGLVILMILISDVDFLTQWVMRIAPGVVAVSCIYAILHLYQPAGSRTPASSAAYQFFAAFTDAATLVFYVFGALAAKGRSGGWTTVLSDQSITRALITADTYILLSCISMHLGSLVVSLWLGWMFRRITKMPPDMNPLESHLTSRMHKRNKSSIATSYTTLSEDSKRLSMALEDRRRSGAPYEDVSRPPSIPFMHTRTQSQDSSILSKFDLPSRQYQIPPSNSARDSVVSTTDFKRSSQLPPTRGSYTEVPLHETGSDRPSTSSFADRPEDNSPTRVAKFTEAWYASESLINRTQQRQRAMNAAAASAAASKSRAYAALEQRYSRNNDDGVSDDEDSDSDDNDSDRENGGYGHMRPDPADVSDLDDSIIGSTGRGGLPISHPNPLRLNPTPSSLTTSPSSLSAAATPPAVPPHGARPEPPARSGDSKLAKKLARTKTPYHYGPGQRRSLVNISGNSRVVSGGGGGGSPDIADQKPAPLNTPSSSAAPTTTNTTPKRYSSIQSEADFCYAKPYGQLRAGTPPIMVGSERQVSSGNDYHAGVGAHVDDDLGVDAQDAFGVRGSKYRRNVSGKMAEEGLAGRRYSRYSRLNQ